MVGRCIKLFIILLIVAAIAVGVSFVPFSLSDKVKSVVEKVTDKLKGVGLLADKNEVTHTLDLGKRDTYKCGNVNVVLDKLEDNPKEGFVKFVHKGENNAPLNVEGFLFGDRRLSGIETGLFNQGAAFFKVDFPELLMVELVHHTNEKNTGPETGENNNNGDGDENGENGGDGEGHEQEGDDETPKLKKLFYFPTEDNTWVKLPDGENFVEKLESVFNFLKTKSANQSPTPQEGTGGPTPRPAESTEEGTDGTVKEDSDEEEGEDDDDEDDEEEEEEKEENEDGEGDEEEPKPKPTKPKSGKSKKTKTKSPKLPKGQNGNLRNGRTGRGDNPETPNGQGNPDGTEPTTGETPGQPKPGENGTGAPTLPGGGSEPVTPTPTSTGNGNSGTNVQTGGSNSNGNNAGTQGAGGQPSQTTGGNTGNRQQS